MLQKIILQAAPQCFVADLRRWCVRDGIAEAVRTHDTPALFDWFAEAASFQAIADRAAQTFIQTHGPARWSDISEALKSRPSCPKLQSIWFFDRCGYVRSRGTCAEPAHYPACPLPALPLRNGHLNQLAFALYLFLRDVCDGDLVTWIDRRLAAVPRDPPESLGSGSDLP